MRLEEVICCPGCKGGLRARTEQGRAAPGEDGAPGWACAACGLRYPVVDGVVDFAPRAAGRKRLTQRLMESERIVRIYEGKWWRGCKLFAFVMKISLADEMALIKRIAAAGPADTVLDLACGPGLYARALAEESPDREVFGLDVSWPMLRYATRKAGRLGIGNVAFMHGDAHQLPFRDSSVDVVNCCGALHLFSDVRRVLVELRRVIKPNGRLSVATVLRTSSPLNRLKAYLDDKFWGVHYFREDELKGLLDEAGFEPAVYHARGIWMIAGGVRRP